MNWFNQPAFESERSKRGITWGRPLRLYEVTDSTNDLALEAIAGDAKSGIVWIAREQICGRGRRGNLWQAAPGECLMFSTLLRYSGDANRIAGLSLAVGMAVADAIERRTLRPDTTPEHSDDREPNEPLVQVKWPNDVYVGGKKIAGVLVESRTRPDGMQSFAVGIGLNVFTKNFPQELQAATSLALLNLNQADLRWESLLLDILEALETRMTSLLSHGLSPMLPDLLARDYLKKRKVRVGAIDGVATGIDERGNLLVQQGDGRLLSAESGHVEVFEGD